MRVLILFICILCSVAAYAGQQIIAIDGANGYVGTALLRDLNNANPRLGLHHTGSIYDPNFLKTFLKDVTVYYQFAAIAAVAPKHTLEEYLLTNSLGPFIASRINKDMTMLSLSSVRIYDVAHNDDLDHWIKKFVMHFGAMDCRASDVTVATISNNLAAYLAANPLPKLDPLEYYGLSKILMEKLLRKSARTRNGGTYIIRAGVIIGDDIRNQRSSSGVQRIMRALNGEIRYDVWNKENHYTPLAKLKAMMMYVVNSPDKFAKFGIFDSGSVTLQQHEFVKKICAGIPKQAVKLRLVEHTDQEQPMVMYKDKRVAQFYPEAADVDQAIAEMLATYKSD